MYKDTKSKNHEKSITDKSQDLTKTTTIDNSHLTDVSGFIEYQRFTPLHRHDFNINIIDNWTEILARKQPKRRSFHSSFIYKEYLYIFGGVDIITGKLGDMKRIRLESNIPEWSDVTPSGVTLGKIKIFFLYKN